MQNHSKRRRQPLQESVTAKLSAYTVGAAAAATGAVGTADGAISYTNYGDILVMDPTAGDGIAVTYSFDFDSDTNVDLILANRIFGASGGGFGVTATSGLPLTSVAGFNFGPYAYPSNLPAGVPIDSNLTFISGARGDMAWGPGYANSQWVAEDGNGTGYLGFTFQGGDGASHAGWLRLTIAGSDEGRVITIHEGAWETDSLTAATIETGQIPEASSLGLLALGGLGLLTRRKRNRPS